MKVVNLSVHRNNRDQRRRRAAARDLVSDVRDVTKGKDIDGFVLVTWDGEGTALCSWKRGRMPQRALPDYVRGVMQSKFSMDDASAIVFGDDDAG